MNPHQVATAIKDKGSFKNFVVARVSHHANLELEQVESAFDCPTKIEFTVGEYNVSVLVKD